MHFVYTDMVINNPAMIPYVVTAGWLSVILFIAAYHYKEI